MLRQVTALSLLLLSWAMRAPAQTGSISPTLQPRTTEGRILQPEPLPNPADVALKPRPVADFRTLPPEIKDKLKQFESAREAFIRRQDELRKRVEGATTDKERAEIRQRVKESLDQWREQARQFRDEARERAKELQRELPKHREALEENRSLNQGGRPRRPGLD